MDRGPVRSRPPAPAATVPRQLTSFVGRSGELRALTSLLGESRLVTITGTGGAGKTRLAAELARSTPDRWPDGTWWIGLAAADDVIGTVVATAELPGRGRPIDIVTSWLATRHTLLVLDNCEHLIALTAAFCQAVLERCPNVTILATSREPIGVPGEARWPLTSLTDDDALHLFEVRARLVRPDFTSGPHQETVVRICERLDRLPLAIEMASARLDMMSEQELLQNLNDRFRVLASSARTVPERQQTMAAAIDWSYRLLDQDEARLFRRLAVFRGGLTMDAAQNVCAESGGPSVMGLLSGLVKKSMVVAERLNDGSTRYRLLESHREFAGAKLAESGEVDPMRQRHFAYFSERKWQPSESANFWHALDWARGNADDRGLALALEIGDSDFSDQSRAKRFIIGLLEHPEVTDTQRARALAMATRLAWRMSDQPAARELADAAIAAARKAGDPNLIARALNGAGLIRATAGELAVAGQMYDEALALLRETTDRRLAADISNTRALLAIEEGDPDSALKLLTSCVAYARSAGDGTNLARYVESLANAQLDAGRIEEAAASWNESLVLFRELSDWFGIIWAMGGLSLVAAARRDDERALRLAAAADRLSRQYSFAPWRFRVDQLDEALRQARARLGHVRAGAAWSLGQTLTTPEAIDFALGAGTAAFDASADLGPLSRREREVVAMVAAGMTNREIAQRLFIAERTAEGHVERIRNKLGVRSRTEVATWAVAHGIAAHPLDKPPPASKV